jgi:hypothetical protein
MVAIIVFLRVLCVMAKRLGTLRDLFNVDGTAMILEFVEFESGNRYLCPSKLFRSFRQLAQDIPSKGVGEMIIKTSSNKKILKNFIMPQ